MTTQTTQPTATPGRSYLPLAAALIVGLTLFRFWFCTRLELVGDEAYYWYCSQRLDLSFFDKGPGAAATIALGTRLFGDTIFGIRFFAVLLSMGTAFAMFFLARMLYSGRVALRAVVIASVVPMLAVGSILMTIDPLSVFFWTVAAILFWKAQQGGGVLLWIATGAMVGIGMLAKYTNLVELICFALFCAWSPANRRQFLRPHFYLMLASALAFSLPIFIWNSRHEWISIGHLLHRGAIDSHWKLRPEELLSFLGQQAGVISPFIFLGVAVAAFRPRNFSAPSEETRYLSSLFYPLFVFYCAISLNKAGQANWAAPSYVSGIILLAAKWEELRPLVEKLRPTGGKWITAGLAVFAVALAALYSATYAPEIAPLFPPGTRWLVTVPTAAVLALVVLAFLKWPVRTAFAVALLETVAMHDTYWLHLPQGRDPLDRVRGSRQIAERAAQVAAENGTKFFIANNYMEAGLLSYYLPGHPDTYLPTTRVVENQFSIWPGYLKRFAPGSTGLFISEYPIAQQELARDFVEVKLVGKITPRYRNRELKTHYFYVCRDLRIAPDRTIP